MINYIIRRILIFIPTLFVITLLAFIINVNAPGDPVDRMLSTSEQNSSSVNSLEQHQYWRKKLALDLPIFYLSIHSFSIPDTLYKIDSKPEKETLERFISQYGNWKEISAYYLSLKKFENVVNANSRNINFSEADKINQLKFELRSLQFTSDNNTVAFRLSAIEKLSNNSQYTSFVNEIKSGYQQILSGKTAWKNYIPVISFYGNNQYHRWLFGDGINTNGLIRGDFGISYVTRQPVSKVIGDKMRWTLFFSLVSVFIAYLVSIPLGAKAGASRDSAFDKISSLILFILYSLPAFWVATVLLMTFANPDMLYIFPASGVKPAVGYPNGAGWLEKINLSLPYLILPLICYTYISFAFLSRTMRVAMLEIINSDFIRTARAKGLPESTIIYRHALRNALFPAITLFAIVFPLAISGSVILETIFSIPGMGWETVSAIQNQDYPMIAAIFTITGILTLVGYLVADILYAIADPRISFTSPINKS